MSWRNPSNAIKSPESESINQISKLRVQNTRYRIELENVRKQLEPRIKQIVKLEQQIQKYKERENKIKDSVIKIGIIANCSDISRSQGAIESLNIVEKKIIQMKEKIVNLHNQVEKQQRGLGDGYISIDKLQAKQKQIELLKRINDQKQEQHRHQSQKQSTALIKLEQLQRQLQKKDNLLGQLSHKLTQCEIQKKDLQAQIATNKSPNHVPQLKKQFEQLLNQISIKEDDYLKSYLLKNQRFQNSTNSISRRNKYDFIFQE